MASASPNLIVEGEYLIDRDKTGAPITSFSILRRLKFAELISKTDTRPLIKPFMRDDCPEIIRAYPDVRHCSPNYVYKLFKTPNDPGYASLHGLNSSSDNDIDAPEAWDKTTGRSDGESVIGVLDSGVDFTHADLAANMWENPGETPGNNQDDDGNGYVDDVYGIDTFSSSPPTDSFGHGTHVAGTIGAVGNNAKGIAGVAWETKIIAVKAADASGSLPLSNIIEGLDYFTDLLENRSVNLIAVNASFGGPGFSQPLYDAVKRLRDAGAVLVAAAGNSASDNDEDPSYPASFDLANVISVAALDTNGAIASFSNVGKNSVHIGAPGVSILSTVPGDRYAYASGTSMAAPHVTGALALRHAQHPTRSYSTLREEVFSTADSKSALKGDIKNGRVLNAAELVEESGVAPTPTASPTPSGTVTPEPTRTPRSGGEGGGGISIPPIGGGDDETATFLISGSVSPKYRKDPLTGSGGGRLSIVLEKVGGTGEGYATGDLIVTFNGAECPRRHDLEVGGDPLRLKTLLPISKKKLTLTLQVVGDDGLSKSNAATFTIRRKRGAPKVGASPCSQFVRKLTVR